MSSESSKAPTPGPAPGDSFDPAEEELLGLAEQLRAEADQLAQVYPPKLHVLENRPPEILRKRRHLARNPAALVGWVSLCAMLALVGVGVGMLLRLPTPDDEPVASPSGPTHVAPARGPLLADAVEKAPDDEAGPLLVTPVSFVSELSDPEFEAWLDLRQDGVEEQIAF